MDLCEIVHEEEKMLTTREGLCIPSPASLHTEILLEYKQDWRGTRIPIKKKNNIASQILKERCKRQGKPVPELVYFKLRYLKNEDGKFVYHSRYNGDNEKQKVIIIKYWS